MTPLFARRSELKDKDQILPPHHSPDPTEADVCQALYSCQRSSNDPETLVRTVCVADSHSETSPTGIPIIRRRVS